MRARNYAANTSFLTFLTMTIVACGGGGGGGGGGEEQRGSMTPDSNAQTPSIAGTWSASSKDTSNCDGGYVYTDTGNWTISQSGNSVSATNPYGETFTSTITGNFIKDTLTYYADGGTVTESFQMVFDGNAGKATYNSSYEWSDGVESCSGTISAQATCISGACQPSNASNNGGTNNTGNTPTLQGEVEPNNAVSQANPITLNLPMLGTTSISGSSEDDDYFSFTAPYFGDYTFDLSYSSSSGNLLNIVAYQYNSSTDLTPLGGDASRLALTMPAGSRVIIQIDPYSAYGTVNYTLTVSEY